MHVLQVGQVLTINYWDFSKKIGKAKNRSERNYNDRKLTDGF